MKWFKKLSHAKFANQSNIDKYVQRTQCNFNNKISDDKIIINAPPASTILENELTKNQYYNVNKMKDDELIESCHSSALLKDNNSTIMINQSEDLKSLYIKKCNNVLTITISMKQTNLNEQAKILENFIKSSNNDVHYSSNRTIVDPDEFFEDPEEVSLYREEMSLLSDWIIIEDELNNCNSEASFKNIKRPSSVISLNTYVDDDDCLFVSCNTSIDSTEATYCSCFFDEIQNGQIILNVKSKCFKVCTDDNYKNEAFTNNYKNDKFSTGKSYCKTSAANDAIANSLMGPMLKDNNFCPLFNSSFDEKLHKIEFNKKLDTFSIQEYFGLNDHGDILINLDHIEESEGFGYFTKKPLFNVKTGCEITEKFKFKNKIQYWLSKFKLKGHPRNRLTSGGPGDSIGAYTLALAADNTSTFSRNIENFITCTKDSRELVPQVVMRNMRQFMSGMKNYLVKHGEGDFQREVQRARSRLKSDEFLNLDTILETVMHRLVVLPLREHLYGLFVDYYKRSGDIQLLVDNIKYACPRNAIDFGIRASVAPPSVSALRQISSILVKLQEAELPLEKLDYLLAAVSSILDSSANSRGSQLGADDLLPLLVLVVAKTGFYCAEIEAEFMWGLLQPSLLSGEAGYYLTALCSAVHVLKSFMSSENEGTGSLDWRSSSLPASSSVLRVIIPDEYNGSLQTRTLPVRPHTTTKDVCRTIAHKARITNPQDYGLFKLIDGEEMLLTDNECPQDVRIAARGKHCILAYKRIDAKIAWPTLNPPSF